MQEGGTSVRKHPHFLPYCLEKHHLLWAFEMCAREVIGSNNCVCGFCRGERDWRVSPLFKALCLMKI